MVPESKIFPIFTYPEVQVILLKNLTTEKKAILQCIQRVAGFYVISLRLLFNLCGLCG